MRNLSPAAGRGAVARGGRAAAEFGPRSQVGRAERVAYWLDDLIRIPFTDIRIGLDPLLGLVPWVGDTATALFSLYIIGSAVYYGLPKVVIARMGLNVAFDYLVGIIPFVGDASDFFIKSNRWNMALLRKHAGAERKPAWGDYLFVGLVITLLLAMLAGGVTLLYFVLKAGIDFGRSVRL